MYYNYHNYPCWRSKRKVKILALLRSAEMKAREQPQIEHSAHHTIAGSNVSTLEGTPLFKDHHSGAIITCISAYMLGCGSLQ
jgi:hypothetical protein